MLRGSSQTNGKHVCVGEENLFVEATRASQERLEAAQIASPAKALTMAKTRVLARVMKGHENNYARCTEHCQTQANDFGTPLLCGSALWITLAWS